MNEPKVWIRKRKTAKGATYHLRWLSPSGWKSRKVGTDKKRADREAANPQRFDKGPASRRRGGT